MGPLFQLIFAGIIYFILASILGLVFVVAARIVSLLKKKKLIEVSQFFWFPVKLGPYFLFAIIANIFFCELVRKVDPPLTDYWSLPVGRGLSLGAVDAPDKWNLWPSKNGGEALISDIVLVGMSSEVIFGETESDGYFVYRLRTGRSVLGLSEDAFRLEMNLDEDVATKLQHPADYYYSNRYFGDLITLLVILLFPLYRFYAICYAFWGKVRGHNNECINSKV